MRLGQLLQEGMPYIILSLTHSCSRQPLGKLSDKSFSWFHNVRVSVYNHVHVHVLLTVQQISVTVVTDMYTDTGLCSCSL